MIKSLWIYTLWKVVNNFVLPVAQDFICWHGSKEFPLFVCVVQMCEAVDEHTIVCLCCADVWGSGWAHYSLHHVWPPLPHHSWGTAARVLNRLSWLLAWTLRMDSGQESCISLDVIFTLCSNCHQGYWGALLGVLKLVETYFILWNMIRKLYGDIPQAKCDQLSVLCIYCKSDTIWNHFMSCTVYFHEAVWQPSGVGSIFGGKYHDGTFLMALTTICFDLVLLNIFCKWPPLQYNGVRFALKAPCVRVVAPRTAVSGYYFLFVSTLYVSVFVSSVRFQFYTIYNTS